jgi:hypothetical protein
MLGNRDVSGSGNRAERDLPGRLEGERRRVHPELTLGLRPALR